MYSVCNIVRLLFDLSILFLKPYSLLNFLSVFFKNRTDSNRILRILENDLILKHDCIWPHGLNFSLHIDSLLEVSEFRKSCLRHHWPPETDAVEEKEIDLNRLRRQVASYAACSPDKPFAAHVADQNHRGDAVAQDDTDSDKSGRLPAPAPPHTPSIKAIHRFQIQ